MAASERRPQVTSRGNVPLAVVAGLPATMVDLARTVLPSVLGIKCRVLGHPASATGVPVYSSKHVDAIFRDTAEFVQAKSKVAAQPAPSCIILLYVPSDTSEALLEAFDFFALPLALDRLSDVDRNGSQLRHRASAVTSALRETLGPETGGRLALETVLQRVKRATDVDAIQLPPKNFRVTNKERLSSLFLALRRGQLGWAEHFPRLTPRGFTRSELPRLGRNETRRALQDYRGLIFLAAHPTAFHAPPRQIAAVSNLAKMRLTLQALYRFGAPFEPGFHHDVQPEQGAAIEDFSFDCAVDGLAKAEGGHVNIYPNDYVRGKKKRKISAASV